MLTCCSCTEASVLHTVVYFSAVLGPVQGKSVQTPCVYQEQQGFLDPFFPTAASHWSSPPGTQICEDPNIRFAFIFHLCDYICL